MKNLEKIEQFIQNEHILTLSTSYHDEVASCSAFYQYDTISHSLIIASDTETTHIQNSIKNPIVAVNIFYHTKEIGNIQGVQAKGKITLLQDNRLKKLYFKRFPYAITMKPTLWQIKLTWIKYTSNKLGFGKKIILNLSS